MTGAVIPFKPYEECRRVVNATIQDFLPLQVRVNGKPPALEVIALDGYPLAKTRAHDTILIPPAGRAEFIVHAPAQASNMDFFTEAYSTGPTGNADVQEQKAFEGNEKPAIVTKVGAVEDCRATLSSSADETGCSARYFRQWLR